MSKKLKKKKELLERTLTKYKNKEISVSEYVKHMAFYLKKIELYIITLQFFTYIFTFFTFTNTHLHLYNEFHTMNNMKMIIIFEG